MPRPLGLVQLEVEAARVAHRLALEVPPPELRVRGLTVGAHQRGGVFAPLQLN